LSRKQEPDLGPVQVNEVILHTAALLSRSVPKTMVVVADTSPSVPMVMANASHLAQALLNLGINSRDAMPDGGTFRLASRLVTISEHEVPANHPSALPGSFVQIVANDTGEGIPQRFIDHVFEPFFTTKAPGKGTGLGLSMVYSCLKAHGGWVTVESVVGRGTTFSMMIPVDSHAADHDAEG
jgi:signal transduction histidine kinase